MEDGGRGYDEEREMYSVEHMEDLEVEESSVNNLRASPPRLWDRARPNNRLRSNPEVRNEEERREEGADRNADVRVDLRTVDSSENPTDTIIIEAIPISPDEAPISAPKSGIDRKKELKGRILSGGLHRPKRPLMPVQAGSPSKKHVSPPPSHNNNRQTSKPLKQVQPSGKKAGATPAPGQSNNSTESKSTTQRPARPHKPPTPLSALPKIKSFSYNQRPLASSPDRQPAKSSGLPPIQLKMGKGTEAKLPHSEAANIFDDKQEQDVHVTPEDLIVSTSTFPSVALNQRRRPQRPHQTPRPEPAHARPEVSEAGLMEPKANLFEQEQTSSTEASSSLPKRRPHPRVRPFNPRLSRPVATAMDGLNTGAFETGTMETAESLSQPKSTGGFHRLGARPKIPTTSAPESTTWNSQLNSHNWSNHRMEEPQQPVNQQETINAESGQTSKETEPGSGFETEAVTEEIIDGAMTTTLEPNERGNVSQEGSLSIVEKPVDAPVSAPSPIQQLASKSVQAEFLNRGDGGEHTLLNLKKGMRYKARPQPSHTRRPLPMPTTKAPRVKAPESVKTSSQYSRIRLITQEAGQNESVTKNTYGVRRLVGNGSYGGGKRFTIPADIFPTREQTKNDKDGMSPGEKDKKYSSSPLASDYHLVLDKENRKHLESVPPLDLKKEADKGTRPESGVMLPDSHRFKFPAPQDTVIQYQNFTSSMNLQEEDAIPEESRVRPMTILVDEDRRRGAATGQAPSQVNIVVEHAPLINQVSVGSSDQVSQNEPGDKSERNRKKIKYRIRIPNTTVPTPVATTEASTTTTVSSHHYSEPEPMNAQNQHLGYDAHNPFDTYQQPETMLPHPGVNYATRSTEPPRPMSPATSPPPPPAPQPTNSYPPPVIRIQHVGDVQRPYSNRPTPTTTEASTFVFPPFKQSEKSRVGPTLSPESVRQDEKQLIAPAVDSAIKVSPAPSPSLFDQDHKVEIQLPNHSEKIRVELSSQRDHRPMLGQGESQRMNSTDRLTLGSTSLLQGPNNVANPSYDSKVYEAHKQYPSGSPTPSHASNGQRQEEDWRGMENPSLRPTGYGNRNQAQVRHQLNSVQQSSGPRQTDTKIQAAPAPQSFRFPSMQTFVPEGHAVPQPSQNERNKHLEMVQSNRFSQPVSNTASTVPGRRNQTRFSVPQAFNFPDGESNKKQELPISSQYRGHNALPQREVDTKDSMGYSAPVRKPVAPPQPPNYFHQAEKVVSLQRHPVPLSQRPFHPPTSIRITSAETRLQAAPAQPGQGNVLKPEADQKESRPEGNPSNELYGNSEHLNPGQEDLVNPSAGSQKPGEINQAAPPTYQPQYHNHPLPQPIQPLATPQIHQPGKLITKYPSASLENTASISSSASLHTPAIAQFPPQARPMHQTGQLQTTLGVHHSDQLTTSGSSVLESGGQQERGESKFQNHHFSHSPQGFSIRYTPPQGLQQQQPPQQHHFFGGVASAQNSMLPLKNAFQHSQQSSLLQSHQGRLQHGASDKEAVSQQSSFVHGQEAGRHPESGGFHSSDQGSEADKSTPQPSQSSGQQSTQHFQQQQQQLTPAPFPSSNNKDSDLHSQTSSIPHASKPNRGNPWLFPSPSPPASFPPHAEPSPRDPSPYFQMNREAAFPHRYPPPYASSNQNAFPVQSKNTRVPFPVSSPAHGFQSAQYQYQPQQHYLPSQQVGSGRVSLPQAIVSQLGNAIRNSRATNFTNSPSAHVSPLSADDEAWLEGTDREQAPKLEENRPPNGQSTFTKNNDLTGAPFPPNHPSSPAPIHESQAYLQEDQSEFKHAVMSSSGSPPPSHSGMLAQGLHDVRLGKEETQQHSSTSDKVIYEFHPSFKAPDTLETGFRPMLPYSAEDPGPLQMLPSHIPAEIPASRPHPPQFYAYTTA